MNTPISKNPISTLPYIWAEIETRWYIIITFGISLIIFFIYHFYYPAPNTITESAIHIKMAMQSINIDNTPTGYSTFLKIFKLITTTDYLLVLFQYLALQLSITYLIISNYILNFTGKWLSRFVLVISLLNPIFINLANLLSPDSLLLCISIFWYSNLLWLIKFPSYINITITTINLTVCFFFSYNAIWYVIPTITTLSLSKPFYGNKILAWSILIIIPFSIFLLIDKSKLCLNCIKATSGWQLASNALFSYYYDENIHENELPKSLQDLNKIVKKHKTYLKEIGLRPDTILNDYYLSDPQSPLRIYQVDLEKLDNTDYNKSYNLAGKIYLTYGSRLIKKNPKNYFKYFIIPNSIFYYTPLPEAFNVYNREMDTIENEIKNWFGYDNNKIKINVKSWRIPYMYNTVPILFGVIKFLFISTFFAFSLTCVKSINLPIKTVIILAGVCILSNMLFSILSAPITLREQFLIIIISAVYGLIAIEQILTNAKQIPNTIHEHY